MESQNHLGDVLDKGYIDEETRARSMRWPRMRWKR